MMYIELDIQPIVHKGENMRSLLAGLVIALMIGGFLFAMYAAEITGRIVGDIVFSAFFNLVLLFTWKFFDDKIQVERRRRRAREVFNRFREEMVMLKRDLSRLAMTADPLNDIVDFFNVVSVWHDRDMTDLLTSIREANVDRRYDDVFNHLTSLQLHFKKAGRHQSGWNRTQKGEQVTADKVFLGDIFGLFTHPVSYWATRKNEPKGSWKSGSWDGHPDVENKNSYDVVSEQARRFIRSHVKPMTQIIDSLQKVTI